MKHLAGKAIIAIVLTFACTAVHSEVVHYEFYEPETADYKVSPGEKEGGFVYNGHPSIAIFEGLYYAVWQANSENKAEVAGRRIYLSTSKNRIAWTKPVDFLIRESINPFVPSVISEEKQGYPFLYNHDDKELWCVWCVDGLPSEMTNAGLYISVLESGSKLWYSTKIFQSIEIGEDEYYTIPTGKPIKLRSGKFILPVKMVKGGNENAREFSVPAFLFSNDDGKNWMLAGTASLPENPLIQCQSSVHQQKDGRIRVFSLPDYRNDLPPAKRLLTTLGTGSELEDELEFDSDLTAAFIETAAGNLATLKLSSERYAMVIGDIFAEVNGPNLCYNPAVFFSRTGDNDFIGGYPFAPGKEISAAQIAEDDGKLYIIYSHNIGSDQPSAIGLSWVEMPEKDKHYLFPRSKDILRSYDTSYIRGKDGGFLQRKRLYNNKIPVTGKDGEREVIIFKNNSAAAIETEPVETEKDESIEITMNLKVSVLQQTGTLSLITIGDIYPVKLVMPSGRAGNLYVSAPGVFQKISAKESDKWFMVKIKYGKDQISFQVDEEDPVSVPSRLASQRFYIGNNCLMDTSYSNDGSAFCLDLQSLATNANRKKSFIDF